MSTVIEIRNGVPVEMGADEFAATKAPPEPPSPAEVDAERDRRIDAGMTFQEVRYQTDQRSRERIDRARISALAAIIDGAQPGDFRWHGEPVDFVWIALDDSRIPMDAQTMVAFGNATAAREGMHIVAANDLKKMAEIPGDYATNETYWP